MGPRAQAGGHRPAMVLLMVLVVLAVVSLIGYGFESVMRAEYQAALLQGERLQALELARSGIDRAVALVVDPDTAAESLWDNPEELRDVAVGSSGNGGWHGRFSVVADDPASDSQPRYGVTSEAAKLNIQTATRAMLLKLPGMTEEMADALIDWRDTDEETGPAGAETAHYQSAAVPYAAKNGPFESVEELLLVRGWSARVLLGEDANRNGLLDANENDGEASAPADNADGRLDAGLAPWLTVWSAEPNRDSQGNRRINLNDEDVAGLVAQVESAFGSSAAAFVQAYREGKAKSDKGTSDNDKDTAAKGRFDSVADLIGAVVIQKDDQGKDVEVVSPFTEDDLEKMLDRLTTSKDSVLQGRIDVLRAPAAVLRTLPGLEEADVSAILNARAHLDPRSTPTAAWLVTHDVLSLEKFRQIEPWVTVHTYQWSIESVGYFQEGGPRRRIHAVVDTTDGARPKVLYWRDLTPLGQAYDLAASRAGLQP